MFAKGSESVAHSAGEAMDENAFLGDFGQVFLGLFDHAVRGGPIQNQGRGGFMFQSRGDGDEVLLGLIRERGLGVVDRQASHGVSDFKF